MTKMKKAVWMIGAPMLALTLAAGAYVSMSVKDGGWKTNPTDEVKLVSNEFEMTCCDEMDATTTTVASTTDAETITVAATTESMTKEVVATTDSTMTAAATDDAAICAIPNTTATASTNETDDCCEPEKTLTAEAVETPAESTVAQVR
ncbi:MAG: hypothetical protein O3A46_13275 [Candidatus Poribacteria bacterium]|nr:hypothetical protein [Candidatus Poribacteria bacterium]